MEVIANIRIETGAVAECFQPRADSGVLTAGEKVNDGDLDERRVVVLEELPGGFADARRKRETAQCVRRGQADVNTGIVTQRAGESVDDFRIRAFQRRTVTDSAQPFARRLLIEQRERDDFPQIPHFVTENGNVCTG